MKLEINFQAHWGRFREFATIPSTWPDPPSSKPWAIAQSFCSKLVDFVPFGIHSKSPWMSPKVVGNPFPSILGRFREFGTIPGTWPNPPSSKPWAIAQAFCSKLVDFVPFGIHSKSPWMSPKVVGNQFPSILGAFQGVWNDSQDLPKSAIFKTMGYSPGFLLKIGRFRAIRNSQEIFMNEPEWSSKSISKHIGGVSGSLQGFPGLDQIRHLQNHGL